MTGQQVDIAFGVNDGYVPHLAAVIASIVRHAPGTKLRFIILHDGVPPGRRALVELVAPQARFMWMEVGTRDVPEFAARDHFNRTTLFRLGLEKLAPADCHRVLYLDADLIVLDDVRSLFAHDLAGASIGAVIDYPIDARAFAQRWNLPTSERPYFNAGVLLIDLDAVRTAREFADAAAFFAKHDRELPWNDQDALNWKYWDRWAALPPAWNAQVPMVLQWRASSFPDELRFYDRMPSLVHFTGPDKPWTPGFYYPWAWLYWRNLARTPFLNEVARRAGVSALDRFRYWVRWLRRKPKAARSTPNPL